MARKKREQRSKFVAPDGVRFDRRTGRRRSDAEVKRLLELGYGTTCSWCGVRLSQELRDGGRSMHTACAHARHDAAQEMARPD